MVRTVDDLGVDASSDYAARKKISEETEILFKEARLIPSQTRVATTAPAYTSEFDTLFDVGDQKALWASFLAPPKYYAYRRRIFAEQLIPELGSPDLQESKLERLEAMDGKEEEKKVLTNLLKNLHTFDQILIDINARRTQYQKG